MIVTTQFELEKPKDLYIIFKYTIEIVVIVIIGLIICIFIIVYCEF